MFLNPKHVIESGWLTHPSYTTLQDWKDNKAVSPNAIDFTIDKLYAIDSKEHFIISEDGKKMRGGEPIETKHYGETGGVLNGDFWTLEPKTSYDAMSNYYVSVPENVAVLLIVRSTFNRNGLFITNGLYDSGFRGHIGFAIHNMSGTTRVAPGTRIGQIMFVAADSVGQYTGGWNHEQGSHWSE